MPPLPMSIWLTVVLGFIAFPGILGGITSLAIFALKPSLFPVVMLFLSFLYIYGIAVVRNWWMRTSQNVSLYLADDGLEFSLQDRGRVDVDTIMRECMKFVHVRSVITQKHFQFLGRPMWPTYRFNITSIVEIVTKNGETYPVWQHQSSHHVVAMLHRPKRPLVALRTGKNIAEALNLPIKTGDVELGLSRKATDADKDISELLSSGDFKIKNDLEKTQPSSIDIQHDKDLTVIKLRKTEAKLLIKSLTTVAISITCWFLFEYRNELFASFKERNAVVLPYLILFIGINTLLTFIMSILLPVEIEIRRESILLRDIDRYWKIFPTKRVIPIRELRFISVGSDSDALRKGMDFETSTNLISFAQGYPLKNLDWVRHTTFHAIHLNLKSHP